MSGLSAIHSASLTALSAMNRLSERVGDIAESVAAGGESSDLAASLTELPSVGIEFQANLYVLQKVQELSEALILQPRK